MIIPEGRVRRVVTTVNEEGKAVVLFDSENPNRAVRAAKSPVNEMWVDTVRAAMRRGCV